MGGDKIRFPEQIDLRHLGNLHTNCAFDLPAGLFDASFVVTFLSVSTYRVCDRFTSTGIAKNLPLFTRQCG